MMDPGNKPQSAFATQPFATALSVTVKAANGDPVPGPVMTFTAPSSGASAAFANGTNTTQVTTDVNGLATAMTLKANARQGGPYGATAAASGASLTAVNFALATAVLPPASYGHWRRTDLIDFPVLVNTTNSSLATTGNGGHVTNALRCGIIFTSNAGCQTKLNHEVESWNSATGHLSARVQVPTVSHASDTSIHLCYGNSSIISDQSRPRAVWDPSCADVWHPQKGTNPSADNSTSNVNDGSGTDPSAGAGWIGGAAVPNGGWRYQNSRTPGRLGADRSDLTNTPGITSSVSVNGTAFHYALFSGSGGAPSLFVDGGPAQTVADTTSPTSAGPAGFGARVDLFLDDPDLNGQGTIDEVRISSVGTGSNHGVPAISIDSVPGASGTFVKRHSTNQVDPSTCAKQEFSCSR